MSDPFFLVVATVLGAVIGSFLNAVIYRMPRPEAAKLGPRSVCPQCETPIPAYLNVPILAWLLLRGRARCCGAKIRWRYPFVEALTAGLFFLLAWMPPSGLPLRETGPLLPAVLAFVFHAYFVSNLTANFFIDYDFRILPDRLTKPLMAVGMIAAVVVATPPPEPFELSGLNPTARSFLAALVGLGVGYGLTWFVREMATKLFRKEAMGLGDVKLMGGLGAFLGWDGALLTFFVGCISGAVIGLVSQLITKDSRIAFGPFLVFGAVVTLFGREPLLEFMTVTWPNLQREYLSSPLAFASFAVVCFLLLIILVRRGRNS